MDRLHQVALLQADNASEKCIELANDCFVDFICMVCV